VTIARALVFAVLCAACAPPRPAERPDEAPRAADPPPAPAEPAAPTPRGPWDAELTLDNAAFSAPRAPSVLVHAPPAFDPSRPLRVVVFLHGWNGCARVLMRSGPTPCRDGDRAYEGWGLAERFDAADTDALFVVVQLAFVEPNGSPGRFVEDGRFAAFIDEMLAALAPRLGQTRIESITLAAHSAGFEAALAVLAHGRVEVHRIVLFDALYRGVFPFTAWANRDDERRLVSLYTGSGRTAQQNAMLASHARRVLGAAAIAQDLDRPLPEQVAAFRVVVARTRAPHGAVPARHLAELLAPLGLAARP
jgi:pimeloyl-ACP methyl ester carboxylesterase